MKVEIAFDLAANGIGDYFTLDDATKGALDSATYTLAGDVLVDVTDDVRAISVKRGRSKVLDKFTAGAANITLDNRSRYYDPTYASSPYFGSIVPRKQVRVSHLDYDLYTGMVEDWNFQWDVSGDSVAEPSCTDGFSILAQQTLTAGTATSQATGARVGAVLDAVGWPATQRAISTGAVTLDADVRGDDVNALNYLQQVELSEGPAALFVGKSGAFTFRDRSYMQTGTSAVTFGTGGIPFIDIAVQYGAETMVNSAAVTWSNGASVGGTAVANDLTAQAAYGVMDVAYATLLDTAADAQDLADWIVGRYAQPAYEVDSITVSMDALSTGQRAQVLALELGDVVTVTWTPNGVGSAITQTLSVDSIEHRATPARHDVTFTLSPTLAAFVLDSDIFGVLDTSVLAL